MNLSPTQQILGNVEKLYKETMELYKSYFTALKIAIDKTPLSDVDKLNELHTLAKDASMALELDLATFDKAISSDTETIKGLQDELKIQSIYKILQK